MAETTKDQMETNEASKESILKTGTEEQQDLIAEDQHTNTEGQIPTAEEKYPTVDPETFLSNFDWGKHKEGISSIDDDKLKEFDSLLEKNFVDTKDQEIVTGKITRITSREAIIDINAKSEGVISLNEFRYNPDIKTGDEVDVLIDIREDKMGQLVISHKKARSIKAWSRIISAHEKEEIITGHIKCRTKGGMIVDVFGIEAFLPGSQIEVKPIHDYDQYVGKNMEFRVVKINHEFKNIVVSHRVLIEADLAVQKREIMSKLEKGQVIEGIVKNLTNYGVFVDLGGVDGLIHITDMSWNRIADPSEILEIDQKIKVVILDFDEKKSRIQLGLKQLEPHPWELLDQDLKDGDKVKGKVTVIADYGAFVEIADSVEGLVHVSEMSWSTHLRSAQEFVKVGDEIEAVILSFDREAHKMSLGMKQLKPNPWADVASKYPVGSRHKGIVRNFANFGVFVELEEGVDGLVYISDLSWTKRIKHPSDFVTSGETIDVVVLELDAENRKLSLGHKQTKENVWDKYETTYSLGSEHEGELVKMVDRGAIVEFTDEVSAFVPQRLLEKEDGSKVKRGERATFKVIEFNKDLRKIVVSHASTFRDDNLDREFIKNVNKNNDKATLGDLSILAGLKKDG